MHKQYAAFAIELIDAVNIKGGDSENVTTLKNWLRQIQAGKLMVGAPIKEDEPSPEEPAK